MKTKLMDILVNHSPEIFQQNEGASIDKIIEVEEFLGHRLPEDFRQLLIHSDGGTIQGNRTIFNYEPAEFLIGHNLNEFFHEYIPEMFVIGDDGGGCIYFYDQFNNLKMGEWSLFYASMGALSYKEAVFLSTSLTGTIFKILDGESFGDLLYKTK